MANLIPKHILLFTPGFAADKNDTTCIPPLQAFAKALLDFPDLKVTILALHYPYRHGIYEWEGITVHSIGARNARFPRRFLFWKKVYNQFRRIHRESPVDIIHSFWWSECAYLGAKLAKENKVKHLTTLMGQEPLQFNFYQQRMQKASGVLCAVSGFQARLFYEKHGIRPGYVIPWGMDTSLSPLKVPGNREIDILGVGSLIPLKDFTTFVEIVESLITEYPEINCCLAGNGPEREKLEKLVISKGLKTNIRFTGKIPRAEVLDLMGNSKILLHPSTYESFGYIFGEALFCGMSVVSRPVGAFEPMARWLTGDTKKELTNSVKELLSNNLDNSPLVLQTMHDTTKSYIDIYQTLA